MNDDDLNDIPPRADHEVGQLRASDADRDRVVELLNVA